MKVLVKAVAAGAIGCAGLFPTSASANPALPVLPDTGVLPLPDDLLTRQPQDRFIARVHILDDIIDGVCLVIVNEFTQRKSFLHMSEQQAELLLTGTQSFLGLPLLLVASFQGFGHLVEIARQGAQFSSACPDTGARAQIARRQPLGCVHEHSDAPQYKQIAADPGRD